MAGSNDCQSYHRAYRSGYNLYPPRRTLGRAGLTDPLDRGAPAIIKAAVQEGFKIHTDQDAEDYTIFAATFSTIYDLTSKRVNGTAKVSYHIKQGPQREAQFTIKHNDWTKNPSSRATQSAQPRGLRRPREDAGEDSQTQWDKRSGWSWKGHHY